MAHCAQGEQSRQANLELRQARQILEIRTAALASGNRSSEQPQSLEDDLAVMEIAVAGHNTATFNRTSHRFHDHLAIATGNVFLLRITEALAQRLDLTKQFSDDSREDLHHSFKEHRAIFSAVKTETRRSLGSHITASSGFRTERPRPGKRPRYRHLAPAQGFHRQKRTPCERGMPTGKALARPQNRSWLLK